jgi:hypothetical protein
MWDETVLNMQRGTGLNYLGLCDSFSSVLVSDGTGIAPPSPSIRHLLVLHHHTIWRFIAGLRPQGLVKWRKYIALLSSSHIELQIGDMNCLLCSCSCQYNCHEASLSVQVPRGIIVSTSATSHHCQYKCHQSSLPVQLSWDIIVSTTAMRHHCQYKCH